MQANSSSRKTFNRYAVKILGVYILYNTQSPTAKVKKIKHKMRSIKLQEFENTLVSEY